MTIQFTLSPEAAEEAIKSIKHLHEVLPQPASRAVRIFQVTAVNGERAAKLIYHYPNGELIFSYTLTFGSSACVVVYEGSPADFGCGDIGTLNGIQHRLSMHSLSAQLAPKPMKSDKPDGFFECQVDVMLGGSKRSYPCYKQADADALAQALAATNQEATITACFLSYRT